MKNIGKHIWGCFISILIISAFWIHPVHADNTVAQLTLHAYGNSLTGASNGNVGHAFLSIKNTTNTTLNFMDYPIPAKEMITVSIWPDKMSPIECGGVYINWEMVVCKNTNTSSIAIDITQLQLDTIAKNTPKESYYHDGLDDTITNIHDDAWHNCTTYSTKMWNLVAPKQYKITDGFLGVDAPKWVSKKINKMSGHLNTPFVPVRKVSSADIFYVTKKKELIPVNLKTPNLYSTKASKNTVSLKWESSKKWLLNNQYNITGYEVKYSLSDGSQTKVKIFSSEVGTITGLKYGKRYKCQVRAVCKKGNYTIYSKYSNIGSFTTSKAPRASVKLNKSKITIYKGKSITLKATVTGASTKVSWESNNTKIASVNSKGKIIGKNPGTCKITASVGGKKAVCTVTVKKKTSTEVAAYKNFLKKESFTTSYSYTVNGHKYTNKNQMTIASFSYVDTNGDRKPELYVRAYKKGDNPSYASDYLISYKNRKCVPVGLEEKLTGYFQDTNVKISVSYAYMYNNPSTPYTKDTTYLYKTQHAYTIQQYLSSGSTVYRKFTTSYTAEMRPASEFYSWYRNYTNNGRDYRSFVFYSNTASNLNNIIK